MHFGKRGIDSLGQVCLLLLQKVRSGWQVELLELRAGMEECFMCVRGDSKLYYLLVARYQKSAPIHDKVVRLRELFVL